MKHTSKYDKRCTCCPTKKALLKELDFNKKLLKVKTNCFLSGGLYFL